MVDVVDNDRTMSSQQLVHDIEASNYFIFHGQQPTYQAALADIETGKADVVLVIPQDYSRDLTMGRQPQVLIAANAVNGTKVEDLISIGTIGLIKACNTFSPQKNIKLATYASRCIENEILMYLRKAATKKHEMSIDEPLKVDWDGNELLLSDILGTDSNCVNKDIEDKAEWNVILSFIEKLESREKDIMKMRFGMLDGKEHTQKEVADKIGISQSYISRLEKKIIGRIRKEMNKNKVCG